MTDSGKLDLFNESDVCAKFYSSFKCSLTDKDIALLECNCLFYSNTILKTYRWIGTRLPNVQHDCVTAYFGRVNNMQSRWWQLQILYEGWNFNSGNTAVETPCNGTK